VFSRPAEGISFGSFVVSGPAEGISFGSFLFSSGQPSELVPDREFELEPSKQVTYLVELVPRFDIRTPVEEELQAG